MNGLYCELALAQLHSPILSVVDIETPALKFPRAAYTTSSPVSGVDYTKSTPDQTPRMTSAESNSTIWAGPRSVGTYSSAFTSSGALIVEIANVVEVTETSHLERTTSTDGKILETSLPQFPGLTSSKEMSRSINPVQVAQTEDNTLLFEGVGLIETFVNSEISSNILTLTAFKTILVTTVLTSMICTCDTSLAGSPSATFTSSNQQSPSALSGFASSTIPSWAIDSNSIQTESTTPLSNLSTSLSSSTTISASSFLSSISTMATSIVQSSTSSIESTSSTSSTTLDSQISATPSDPPSSTVIPVSPPADPVCNPGPPQGYADVNPGDVTRHVDSFCKTDFDQDCLINGYFFQDTSSLQASIVGYNMSITPVPLCISPSTATCEYPLLNTDFNCSYNLHGAWRNCTGNKGMGGSIAAGCLVYNLSPIAYCQGPWTDPFCNNHS